MQRLSDSAVFFTVVVAIVFACPLSGRAQTDVFGSNPRVRSEQDVFSSAHENRRYMFQGHVVNETGEPVGDARVELRNMAGQTLVSVTVGSAGWFQFPDVNPGWYELVTNSGIEQRITSIEISSFTDPVTIRLRSASAARSESSVSVNSLTVPSKAWKAFEAADRLFQENDATGAWSKVNKALQVFPKFAAALTLRGVLQMNNNQPQAAMGDFVAALEADRTYQLAYIGLAAGHNLMGQFDQALQILDQGNSFASQSWQAHFEASKALLGKGSFGRALEEAKRAGTLLGHDGPSINIVKANAYIGLKDVTSATSELRQVLQQEASGPLADHVRAVLAHLESR